MKLVKKAPAILLLEDGTYYQGKAIGKIGTKGGEICFNTGMSGYQEIYTDPSYYGQIIVNTTSHIGNYGVLDVEQESNTPKISALVVNSFSDIYSREKADHDLQYYLEKSGIVGIADIDTRKLVRHIRSKGAMNAVISSEITDLEELKKVLDEVPSMDGLELSSQVSTQEEYFAGHESAPKRVAVLDLGIKTSILKNLAERGCYCKVFPAKTTYEQMKAWNPDGYFVSNGPGDPGAMEYAVETVKNILKDDRPLFGICLGHQILARANDISTYKMHHGHRGLNHPVKNLESGKSEVTSQNHGFSVNLEESEKNRNLKITHINLNDNTVAGIKMLDRKAFSVQYHPESSPGPHDSRYLFDQFLELMNT
ncbi:glutamine-hydrolyzing carbamoyl-phosphate synthase small subunit [Catalinimonas niigatensis]|uniref:glutamine-hydrolyzing carbamoyl-phosphate synthase small subunit n=1 Tax=Catalinimonas niigatensis TaxID=1397264 RepID=UPI0026656B2E|nr:glutamine-hydrolyzing carbamoyl-phosphate synthase small subunit [Catalinimonas niigatensis]WPP52489.1 glutamine-hydrolyzing carbamoyl-phosphate synthase small subunit [Catalinimonas niigatensis]